MRCFFFFSGTHDHIHLYTFEASLSSWCRLRVLTWNMWQTVISAGFLFISQHKRGKKKNKKENTAGSATICRKEEKLFVYCELLDRTQSWHWDEKAKRSCVTPQPQWHATCTVLSTTSRQRQTTTKKEENISSLVFLGAPKVSDMAAHEYPWPKARPGALLGTEIHVPNVLGGNETLDWNTAPFPHTDVSLRTSSHKVGNHSRDRTAVSSETGDLKTVAAEREKYTHLKGAKKTGWDKSIKMKNMAINYFIVILLDLACSQRKSYLLKL